MSNDDHESLKSPRPATRAQRFETVSSDARVDLAGGMVRSPSDDKIDYTLIRKGPLFKRWAELLARGAKVYGKNNWLLGTKSTDTEARKVTKDRYLESAARHFEQWLAGDRSEDHAAAVMFNMNGYEAMLDTDPPLAVLERHAVACKGSLEAYSFTAGEIASAMSSSVKHAIDLSAIPGRRVRVVQCDHAADVVGREGVVERVDPKALADGSRFLPYQIRLDRPSSTHGSVVWCEAVEVVL